MPRVLRILNRINLGGPVLNVSYLTKYLAPEFETKLIVGVKDEEEEDGSFVAKRLGLEYTEIPSMKRKINLIKDWQAYQEIKKIIKEFKPDIVHTHAAKSGTIGRLAAISCGVPIILHTFHGHVFHSYFGKSMTKFFIKIEQYLARNSTKIIAISEKQKTELCEQFFICPNEKVAVIPLGFDLDKFNTDQKTKRRKFRNQFVIQDDEIVIGIIGRIVPIKNHLLFIDAIHQTLKQTQKKIRVLIIGDGDLRILLQEKLTQYGISFNYFPENTSPQTVTFTSWLLEMDEVYAGIDIVALSSLNEGTPVSLIEAQAANKPIVTTNVGGVKDVTLENETALLVPSEDVHAFKDALLKMIEDDALRDNFSKRGSEFVKKRFDKSRLVEDMRTLYYELLKQKK